MAYVPNKRKGLPGSNPSNVEYEITSPYSSFNMSSFQIGLGERFDDSMKQNAHILHQVEPYANLTETCGSVRMRAHACAAHMVKKGVKPEDVVVICSRNHADQTVAILATLFCGATVAPIDYGISLSEGAWLIHQLKPTLAFCDPRSVSIFERGTRNNKIKCQIVSFGNDAHTWFSRMCGRTNSDFNVVKVSQPEKSCAFILPTQGTTGQVKLVRLSHYSIMYQQNCCKEFLLKDAKKIISFFPLCFNVQVLLNCLCFDSPITKILPGTFNERNICRLIHDLNIDSLILTPYYCLKLVNHPAVHDFNMSYLKTIHLGGSLLCNALVTDLLRCFLKVGLFVWYSITEMGIVSGMRIEDINEVLHNVVNCGQLFPGITARINDLKTKSTLPHGKHGEILLKGPGMMLGYHNNPSLTNSSFEEGFFKTEDVGFYDKKDSLYVRGRVSEMITRQGEMFCAVEIEDIILKHPCVRDTVVIGTNDAIIACVVKLEDCLMFTDEKLMKYIRDRAPLERRPTEIRFFDEFPQTAIGKNRRHFIVDSLTKVSIDHSRSLVSAE